MLKKKDNYNIVSKLLFVAVIQILNEQTHIPVIFILFNNFLALFDELTASICHSAMK